MKAKKTLGQNFLKSRSALGAILRASDLKCGDTVLEIGPGKGVLTAELLHAVGDSGVVLAVEKDPRMVEYLSEKFAEEIESKNLVLLQEDILDFDISTHVSEGMEYVLVANIPYYITGQILKKFLQYEKQPVRAILMVQKEVAKRIVAEDKKESILSVSVKVFGEPKYIKTVPAKYFSPAPKVDSAILLIEHIKNPFRSWEDEELFFETLKKGFSSRRKLLTNNLRCDTAVLKACDIPTTARAENLSVEGWACLQSKLS